METEKPKSFIKLLMDMIVMIFNWWRKNKKIEEISNEELNSQKLNNFNKVEENLKIQYNIIDKDKIEKSKNELTIEEINNKLNEKFK